MAKPSDYCFCLPSTLDLQSTVLKPVWGPGLEGKHLSQFDSTALVLLNKVSSYREERYSIRVVLEKERGIGGIC